MSALEFLGLAETDARATSPLARALSGGETAGVRDLSLSTGKLEVRGDLDGLDVDAEVVGTSARRALVLCPVAVTSEIERRLRDDGRFVVDVTGALAGIELYGEQVMRRLTDLDLDALPAVGMVARVPATVLRDGDRFRLFFPQEYGHFVAEVVLDTLEGLSP